MHTLTEVNKKDREISMQFSFSNHSAIPQFLEDLTEENTENAAARKQMNEKGSGVDLTNGGQLRGKMVDLRKLPSGLLQSNYELVGVWKQKRIQTKKGWAQNKPYWMVRFRFRLRDSLSEYWSTVGKQARKDMDEKRSMLLGELVTICSLAFWQVRAWRNPWFQDGKILPDVHAISLNFEGRKPLYEWDPPKEFGDDDLLPQYEPDIVFSASM